MYSFDRAHFSAEPVWSTSLVKASHRPRIGHVRYINIQAWLRGFQVKIANFSSFFCPSIPKRDLDTKKTTPNIDVWPESPGAMLEYIYWYIEHGLLAKSREVYISFADSWRLELAFFAGNTRILLTSQRKRCELLKLKPGIENENLSLTLLVTGLFLILEHRRGSYEGFGE